ncbi:MAG: TOMM precursor leader peptide-binding protein [Gammaproteobacteria bacterium]|nr:TOMM precursor leader peptide-binding protein [Gammaproteobacteria bacterium]
MSEGPETKKNGILAKTTIEDRGLVKLPALTPHLEFHNIGNDQTLLISESFNTLLHGRIYTDLIPLLDGSNTIDEIVQACGAKHVFSTLLSAVDSLSTHGYIVSADHSLDSSRAAYWSSLGASPRWVEQALGHSRVAVRGASGELQRNLEVTGVNVGAANPNLTVLVCEDYLSSHFSEVNRRHLETGEPWLLVRPRGIQPMLGPVFLAVNSRPCWTCLEFRLRSHQEVHEFLRHIGGQDASYKPHAEESSTLHWITALASAEIAKWIVLAELAPIHQHTVSINLATLQISHHFVSRRPQCSACGDRELVRPDRSPEPLILKQRPTACHNSGGTRSVDPEVTLARYRHLVSPISGVVSWLSRTSDETDSWLHVYWAGSNFGMRSRSLSSLRRSLRSKSAGKGSTREQSEVSALCEAIERYSGSYQGSEICLNRSFRDLKVDDAAIYPNDVQLFSDAQLEHAEEINAQGHPYNFIPCRFEVEAKVDWTPVWSLTQRRHRYLPTSMLYTMPAEHRGHSDLVADSNGCAAGNSVEEAILQGFYELVERDAFAIWWYNRLKVPEIDIHSFDDDFLSGARDYYHKRDREIWILDITADINIPTFVALSRRPNAQSEDIIYGAGAHPNARIAALRAVCELNQCLSWLPGNQKQSGLPAIDDPLALSWWENAQIDQCPWLAPSANERIRMVSDYSVVEFDDMREEVEKCCALVEEKGMEFLVLDQTRPDIELPVVRVIVPGMRHFWARFAPGRLYDVPVAMGRCQHSLKENELNSTPVIA